VSAFGSKIAISFRYPLYRPTPLVVWDLPEEVDMDAETRTFLVKRLDGWLDSIPDADRPFVGLAGGGVVLSPRQIVDHVKRETPLGKKFLARWHNMALEHIAKSDFGRPQ
jgi:hypothetical protein